MRSGAAIAALVFMAAAGAEAQTLDLSGDLSLQGRWYPQSPAFPDQRSSTGGLVFEPTLYGDIAETTSVTVTAFYRYDSADSQRTHVDLREAYLLTYGDWDENSWELRLGVDRVFWAWPSCTTSWISSTRWTWWSTRATAPSWVSPWRT